MAESTFQRVRPFKVLAIVMVFLAIILNVIALIGDWVHVTFSGGQVNSWGVWYPCSTVVGLFELCVGEAWLAACAALLLISLIVEVIVLIVGTVGFFSKNRRHYNIAAGLCIVSMIIQVISLIIYPVMFTKDVRDNVLYNESTSKVVFDWSYGIAWGAYFFVLGSTILFFIRVKEEEETHPMQSAPNYYRA